MSHESTEDRHRPVPGAATRRGPLPGGRRDYLNAPAGGGTGTRGLLVAALVLLGLIALFAVFSIGGSPDDPPVGLQGEAPHLVPDESPAAPASSAGGASVPARDTAGAAAGAPVRERNEAPPAPVADD